MRRFRAYVREVEDEAAVGRQRSIAESCLLNFALGNLHVTAQYETRPSRHAPSEGVIQVFGELVEAQGAHMISNDDVVRHLGQADEAREYVAGF